MKLIITVDAEADNQWNGNGCASVENIRYLPRFQSLCEDHGFRPTYLVTWEVVADMASRDMLGGWARNGAAEIGAHLHPWSTPPFSEEERKEPRVQSLPCELDNESLDRKLVWLTEHLTNAFHLPPAGFRAGRWGLDGRTVAHLGRLGYQADCSVTPKLNWKETMGRRNSPGGPDFRKAPVRPYFPSCDDVCRPGFGRVLEVPPTILYTGRFVREESDAARRFSALPDNFMKRLLDRLFFRRRWLRIEPWSRCRDWTAIYRAAERNNLEVLEFMIHSSELMPGGSPLSPTPESVERIYGLLTELFRDYRARGAEGIPLGEYARSRLPADGR